MLDNFLIGTIHLFNVVMARVSIRVGRTLDGIDVRCGGLVIRIHIGKLQYQLQQKKQYEEGAEPRGWLRRRPGQQAVL